MKATVRTTYDPISGVTTYEASCVSPYGRIGSHTLMTSREAVLEDLVQRYREHMAIERARRPVVTVEEVEIEV